MLYYYVDETTRRQDGWWYASIGGALVRPEDVLAIESALETVIVSASTLTPRERKGEFKYTEFFRDQPDEVKIEILEEMCGAVTDFNIVFLLGQAKHDAGIMQDLIDFHETPERAMYRLALARLPQHLAPYTASEPVQKIVDLGVSEAFKGLYGLYMMRRRGRMAMQQMGFDEEHIPTPNHHHLLPPLFVASHDSRILQLSDVLLGLSLAKTAGALTEFKKDLLQATRAIQDKVKARLIEWNSD